ncbi:MAG: EAL domain-containing protein [Oscillospiraceae bacterium]|nr:EAL domain-containing protein [Oscillospiraceae bacterium]
MLRLLGGVGKNVGSQAAVQIISFDEKYTAGILKRSDSAHETDSILPVCDMSQMIIEITRNTAPSLLALLEIQTSDGRVPSKFSVFEALTAILRFTPENAMLSAHSDYRFWLYIPDFGGDSAEYLTRLQNVVKNSEEPSEQCVTFSAGIGSEDSVSARRISTAEFALYEACLRGTGSVIGYSPEQYESNKTEFEQMSRFLRLVNENLFLYHFQPIVSARNGEIVAYEMLMRSDSSIGMYPLEILDCAEKAKRLYDIEAATVRNSLAIIEKNQDMLKNRKLFVNSITAHMLTDKDWNALENEYGELMEKMVIEFTEQTELDDERIAAIRERLGRWNIRIAIDDYGTGYSNTSNLIRYDPDYVKIDRALIQEINTKPKVRKLVSGIIEFIHENGYQALAEGVETYDELQTMIQLGSDLIQGYYVSRPKPVMLLDISENIRSDIETIYRANSANISTPYHASENEVIDLRAIKDCYNSIVVESEHVTIKGGADFYSKALIIVKNGIKTKITFEDAYMKNDSEYPIISAGEGSEVELEIKGENELNGKGIYVPDSSSLHMTGDGSLKVVSNKADCYAIGTDSGSNPGDIVIEIGGKLVVEANGDTVTAIGGGRNERAKVIRILGGDVSVNCSGRSCVGIGVAEGGSIIDIEGCKCSVRINAPDIAAIGSLKGRTDIDLKNYTLEEELSGINIAGVGSIEKGTGRIMMASGSMNGIMKGRTINCIGSRNGSLNCHARNSALTLYCEGGTVVGIGDMYGDGDVIIEETELDFEFHTGEGLAYGSRSGLVSKADFRERLSINA